MASWHVGDGGGYDFISAVCEKNDKKFDKTLRYSKTVSTWIAASNRDSEESELDSIDSSPRGNDEMTGVSLSIEFSVVV